MVLGDRRRPGAEPLCQWFGQALTLHGVPEKYLPLGVIWLARLVQYRNGDGELPDVMKKGGPTKPIPIGRGKLQLVGDQVRQGPYPFGMAASQSIVLVQWRCQRKNLLCGRRRLVSNAMILGLKELAFKGSGTAGSAGHREPARSMIREDQGHLQERREGQSTAGEPTYTGIHDPGSDNYQRPPGPKAEARPRLWN
jgi:hypothetical protein